MKKLKRFSSHQRAFTLVELLVVIAVLAVLMTILIPVVSSVRKRAQVKRARAQIETLKLALSAYESDFGAYPPSSVHALGAVGNGTNEGVECLLRCLTTTAKRGPYFEPAEDDLENLDGDVIRGNPTNSFILKDEALEILDPWGNPYVYINLSDYRGGTLAVRGVEETARVEPGKSEKTGQYHGFPGFQIWSFGPDGKDNGGDGDDVNSWD